MGVLLAVGPAVGAARLVNAAPMLALAIDYDVEDVDARWTGGSLSGPPAAREGASRDRRARDRRTRDARRPGGGHGRRRGHAGAA